MVVLGSIGSLGTFVFDHTSSQKGLRVAIDSLFTVNATFTRKQVVSKRRLRSYISNTFFSLLVFLFFFFPSLFFFLSIFICIRILRLSYANTSHHSPCFLRSKSLYFMKNYIISQSSPSLSIFFFHLSPYPLTASSLFVSVDAFHLFVLFNSSHLFLDCLLCHFVIISINTY